MNRKKWILMMLVVIVILVLGMMGCGETNQREIIDKGEAIDKLLKFTNMEEQDDKYSFHNDGTANHSFEKWCICYTTENEFVTFKEDAVIECFTYIWGNDCFPSESTNKGGFGYDLDENAIRVYFDIELSGKTLSIINYSIEDEELTVMVDGERYFASDELEKYIEEYGIIDIMLKDIENFKQDLEDIELSYKQVASLKYEDIVDYIEIKK